MITLCADIMFFNRVKCFMNIYQHIGFWTSDHITDTNIVTLVQSLLQVKRLYNMRGLKIQTVMVDGQFEPIKANADNEGMEVNTTSRDEHKPVIERYIRIIKDRSRSVWSTLPFKEAPVRTIIDLIDASVFLVPCFPTSQRHIHHHDYPRDHHRYDLGL